MSNKVAFVLVALMLCMFYSIKRAMDAAYEKDLRLFLAYLLWNLFLIFLLVTLID
jgi:hypothetical protein